MLITFFAGIFLQLFQRIKNSASNSAFFEKIIFVVILALLANFKAKRAQNEIFFFKGESE
jgi:hypothetical protein